MTDKTNNEIQADETAKLKTLKTKADMLGVTYHPNIGLEKLKEKVDAKMAEQDTVDPVDAGVIPVLDQGNSRAAKRKDCAELVRVIVTSRDPNKKDWPGEIFSVGNSTVGFFKKYVPYGHEWHIPKIIFNTIRDRKVQVFVPIIDSKGNKTKEPRLISAYSVDVLDPLTPAQLADLAKAQAASGRLED